MFCDVLRQVPRPAQLISTSVNNHPRWAVPLLLLCFVVLLGGCSGNFKSINHYREVGEAPSIISIDARQRVIISNDLKDQNKLRRFCSEPSPDVFTVVAQALSAGGMLEKSVDPTAIKAALNLAFSDAEQGSTIPRTQTINMLRELMYRTCERYLSGAYTPMEVSVQAVRDQRLMVSILAIEQLTGAVTPKPVVIGVTGASKVGAGEAAILRLDDALKARDAARTSYAKAEKAFNELNGKNKICDAIAQAVKEGEELSKDQKEKQPQCDEARTAMASAKALLQEKESHYGDLKRLAMTTGVASSTATTTTAPGGMDQAAQAEAITEVANAVKEIVELNFNDNTEMMMFCWKVLIGKPGSIDYIRDDPMLARQKLQTNCLDYLSKTIEAEKTKLEEKIKEATQAMEQSQRSIFNAILPTLKDPKQREKYKKILINKLNPDEWGKVNECLFEKEITNEEETFNCFKKYIRNPLQRKLEKLIP